VRQDDHHIEQPKRGGRNHEHIDRGDAGGLIALRGQIRDEEASAMPEV